jgi:hypothetical protein
MSTIFKELGDKFLKIFVDNLNIHSENWEEHLQHLDAIFFKLREVKLKLNPRKCCFVTKSITFLGHVVSNEGTELDPGKIDVMLHFPKPKTVINIRSFLRLTKYYLNYVQRYLWFVATLALGSQPRQGLARL